MEPNQSTRQQKVARQIQKDISEILMQQARHLVQGTMTSVTQVRVSPDLSVARVYLSVFPFDKSAEVIARLREHVSLIRGELGRRVKNQLRIVPELVFSGDDSIEYVDRIDQLLK